MARAATRCVECDDFLWFGDADIPPQRVDCPCGETALTEDGPVGSFVVVSDEERDSMTDEERKNL